MSIKELNDFCVLNARYIVVHAGKLVGIRRE